MVGVAIDEEDDEAAAGGKVELKPTASIPSHPVEKPIITTPESVQPPDKSNGKPYKFPSTAAEKFYKTVQQSTGDYYKSPHHLLEIIGGWFNFAAEGLWDERLSLAVDHARQTRESAQVPVVESEA
jgi:hypothetical protein